MYSEPMINSGGAPKQKQVKDQVEVTVRNLPNQIKTEQILEYLSIAGPIKSKNFVKEEERYSATIVYQDSQSAFLCKKFLGDEYYKGRILTITVQIKKSYPNGGSTTLPSTLDQDLAKQIMSMQPEQKRQLLSYLKNLKGSQQILQKFLQSRPKIVQSLLGKYGIE